MPVETGSIDVLRNTSPFRYLNREHFDWLISRIDVTEVPAGRCVYRKGAEDRDVYMVSRGRLELFDPARIDDEAIRVVSAGEYLGEWEAVFHENRQYSARALELCVVLRIKAADFVDTLGKSPGFAQSMGTILRDAHGIFSAFDRFKVALMQHVNQGHIGIGELLPLYRKLEPALHEGAADDRRLDLNALLYAVRRLPANVTRTFAFLLLDELPVAYPDPDRYFPAVATAARRRDVWEMLPGKNMVLLRSGDSDLIDLITAMCVYSVEARKIRERLYKSVDLAELDRFAASKGRTEESVTGYLMTLPFSSREVRGLLEIWPEETTRRIADIARHREMFSVHIRRQRRNHNSRRSELWASQIARVAERLFGCRPGDLPESLRVHIVSSNTHSIANCLNPWYEEGSGAILTWGRANVPALCDESWPNERDLVYALSRDFFRAHPKGETERRSVAEQCGVTHLGRTVSTGVQVQFIRLEGLRGRTLDPMVRLGTDAPVDNDVIVNIDYAFGGQAEYIIRDLLLLFGANVSSVNFFGKAGALVGKRGDILVPTAFVEQSTDFFQPLNERTRTRIESHDGRLGGQDLHLGPLLTVDGTLLQNRRMLNFYRHIWSVVGIEMEGTHYYRQILESQQLGVVSRHLDQRFFYYVSDLPLHASERLARPLKASEGVPPLYAITRHILQEIIETGRRP